MPKRSVDEMMSRSHFNNIDHQVSKKTNNPDMDSVPQTIPPQTIPPTIAFK